VVLALVAEDDDLDDRLAEDAPPAQRAPAHIARMIGARTCRGAAMGEGAWGNCG